MAIDPLSTWKSTLKNLPKVADSSWALNFAQWYADRIVNINTDPSAMTASGFVFLFPVSVFAGALVSLTPTTDPISGIQGFADAWETAILSMVYPATLAVGPGTVYGAPSPATTFSIVASVVLNPASILAAKAKILELVSATPVDDADNSQFPQKFRDATLLLKIDVTGTDSVSPPSGPNPLMAMGVPLA